MRNNPNTLFKTVCFSLLLSSFVRSEVITSGSHFQNVVGNVLTHRSPSTICWGEGSKRCWREYKK